MRTFKRHHLFGVNPGTLVMLVFTLLLNLPVNAQTDNKNRLSQMINNDRPAVNTIAGYDENIQTQVLQIAQSPDVLKQLGELQKKSMVQFRIIIDNYNQDEQTAFYEMARYPNLISDLVRNGKPTAPEVLDILQNYPSDIHKTTIDFARKYFVVLVRIDRLNNEIDQAFQTYLEPYNTQTRESVKVLLAYPEIVSALVEDKEFTTLLGIVYREDPEWIIRRLDRISQQLALQNQEDVDAYKTQIQSDPEAYNELINASNKFAREKNQVRYLEQSYDPILEVNVVNSYPFWFGYPYWYSDPYWRPRPIYYHTGFYRNNIGNIVFVKLPSSHFIHWHTHFYPTLFPHLSYNYYSYYENHYVNRYRNSNRPVLHNSFYKSIEANVVNNPRVNNSTLKKIDHQRGNTVVSQPNTNMTGSTRRGSTGTVRQGATSIQRQGTGTNGTTNRREYNTANPGRSEGSYNRNGAKTGSDKTDGGATRSFLRPGGTSTGRQQQGTSTNRSNIENSRSNNANDGGVIENAQATTTRKQNSSAPETNRANEQRQSEAPQQRRETSAPAEQTRRVSAGREASQPERNAAPERRETPSSRTQSSGRSVQQEVRVSGESRAVKKTANEEQSPD